MDWVFKKEILCLIRRCERRGFHMAEKKLDKKNVEDQRVEAEPDFKGTFISVMLLGGFIIVTWVGVWLLFLSR